MQREGQSLPESVKESFPGEETSDLSLKSRVNVCQGNKRLAKRKKLLCHVGGERQQILCGYTQEMVEDAARNTGRGWPEKALTRTSFFFSPFPGGDGQVMKSVKQKNNQSNLYYAKVISAAIGGKRGTLPYKSRGDILRQYIK